MNAPESPTALVTDNRLHDLDALRGFAMLLGIVLHAAMSFLPGIKPIWGVEDIYASDAFGLVMHLIHGWRMQLFFFISGFFTMMLWRKRGSNALFVHRTKRIILPLVVAMFTITPAWMIAQGYARSNHAWKTSGNFPVAPMHQKENQDKEAAKILIYTPQDLDEINIWQAVFDDDAATIETYLKLGGDKNQVDPKSGSSLLHAAIFYGKVNAAAALIEAQADQSLLNNDGLKPAELLGIDWGTTQFVAKLTGIDLKEEELQRGREAITAILENQADRDPSTSEQQDESSRRFKSSMQAAEKIDIHAAVAANDVERVKLYLDQGGDVNLIDPSSGSTPLHTAAFFGKADAAAVLIDNGAKLDARNNDGQSPVELLYANWELTNFIASMMSLQINQEDLKEGRQQIAATITEKTGRPIDLTKMDKPGNEGIEGLIFFLFYYPFFNHLWFLWFLCWFVLLFLLKVTIVQGLGIKIDSPSWLHTPAKYLVLIPMVTMPQYFMARMPDAFGPDTSVSIIPPAAIFIYYLLFFFAGAAMFSDRPHKKSSVIEFTGLLLLGLITFIAAMETDPYADRLLFSLLQSAYAWLMTFGMIGLFSHLFSKERYWVRYLSDSSYWLYLAHLPLVLILQDMMENWEVPAAIKFLLITVTCIVTLLISYQLLVRNTFIGVLLNGKRYPPRKQQIAAE